MKPFIDILNEATLRVKEMYPDINFLEAKGLPEMTRNRREEDVAQWRFIFQDVKKLVVLYYTEGKFSRVMSVCLA